MCTFNGSDSWVILTPIEQSIKHKIESVGTPLRDWDINIYRGVLTGYNEAFIISTEKRDEILAKCKSEDERTRTAELIRPILRGRDIKRYGYEWAELWLIATFPSRHYNIDDYPSVREYLLSYGIERLEQTGKVHTVNGEKIKARKKTNNKWFETQDSISYLEDFLKPKIVYSETNNAFETKICIDTDFHLADKTCFILVCENERILKHVYKWMSSKVFSYYMRIKSPLLGSQGISLTKETVEKFPLCPESMDYGFTSQECDEIERF